jgi:glycerol uptake facilitator protein
MPAAAIGRGRGRVEATAPLAEPPIALAPSLARRCVAEAIGTWILVFLGVGAVHAAVLGGAQSGIWQVAVVWAVAIALAIHATAAVSGAHINPAITAAFAAFGAFPWREVPAYWAAQLAGAFLAAWVLYGLFGGMLSAREAEAGVVRGGPGSEITAMCFGEYFPHPDLGTGPEAQAKVSLPAAFAAEAIGTLLLVFVVFALTEGRNRAAPGGATAPLLIGLTVAALISVLAPLTQAGFNPARDFGPRLFAWLAGWDRIAIPGPRGGFFTVYVLGPLAGGLAGAGLFRLLVRPGYGPAPTPTEA